MTALTGHGKGLTVHCYSGGEEEREERKEVNDFTGGRGLKLH